MVDDPKFIDDCGKELNRIVQYQSGEFVREFKPLRNRLTTE